MILNGETSNVDMRNNINTMTSCYPNTKCGNTTKTIYGATFGLREANFQIDKEEISTNTARKAFETS
jgi:hypothetical protein